MGSVMSCFRQTFKEDGQNIRAIVREVLQEIEEQQQQPQQQSVSRSRSHAKYPHGSQHTLTPKRSKQHIL